MKGWRRSVKIRWGALSSESYRHFLVPGGLIESCSRIRNHSGERVKWWRDDYTSNFNKSLAVVSYRDAPLILTIRHKRRCCPAKLIPNSLFCRTGPYIERFGVARPMFIMRLLLHFILLIHDHVGSLPYMCTRSLVWCQLGKYIWVYCGHVIKGMQSKLHPFIGMCTGA